MRLSCSRNFLMTASIGDGYPRRNGNFWSDSNSKVSRAPSSLVAAAIPLRPSTTASSAYSINCAASPENRAVAHRNSSICSGREQRFLHLFLRLRGYRSARPADLHYLHRALS